MPEELPAAPVRKLSFANLDPTDFEEFVFDLLVARGFVNVDWRKGTPKNASPADGGRDIVAQWLVTDADGHQRFETWFVDAKHYSKGVPPAALEGLMAWSQAERPDVALVAMSGFLSNPAKDWIETYTRNNKPPFRIRHWELPQISLMLGEHRELIPKHDIIEDESIRTRAELLAAEKEFFDKVWYIRSLIHDEKVADGERDAPDEKLRAQIDVAQQRVRDTYGEDNVGPWNDWEWGFVNGKLSALRWMLGDEWDFLDT
jgi:hypothetical protein